MAAPRVMGLLVVGDAADADAGAIVVAAETLGHAVHRAGANDAIASIDALRPALVVLRWRDDEATRALFGRLRATTAGAGAFMLAIADDAGTLVRALEAGFDDFALVPVSPDVARARIAIADRQIAQADARRRVEDALARAERLAGIGEMAIALQHQINNPLAALLGHVALIEHGLIDPGEERELLAVVAEQAHRIAAVVKRLSALRNPDSVEYVGRYGEGDEVGRA